MKPVVIFRHAAYEGPGYLGIFLDEKHIPWQLVKIDQGEPLPASIQAFSGVILMGGPMSVNDDLPWIAPLLALIREAVASDIPLLGHCLGGQLISRALGASVSANPVKEIGWGELRVQDNQTAKDWFGAQQSFLGFHWHGETFSLPPGATPLLSSDYCQNQAYAIGQHLAFQCHIEMTVEMVNDWCEQNAGELAESAASPGVQSREAMLLDLQSHVAALNRVARNIYTRWIKGLHV